MRRSFYKEGNKRDIAIFEVLANTGIRVSELCSLKLSDVQISERKGKLIVRCGKGQKYREVPLNSDARKALNEYLKSRADENNERLFLGERGPLTPSGVFRIIKRYARDAGGRGIAAPAKAYFCEAALLQAGVDIVTVQQILGHANLNTTAVYLKPDYTEQETAVEKISELHLQRRKSYIKDKKFRSDDSKKYILEVTQIKACKLCTSLTCRTKEVIICL